MTLPPMSIKVCIKLSSFEDPSFPIIAVGWNRRSKTEPSGGFNLKTLIADLMVDVGLVLSVPACGER